MVVVGSMSEVCVGGGGSMEAEMILCMVPHLSYINHNKLFSYESLHIIEFRNSVQPQGGGFDAVWVPPPTPPWL